MGNCISGTQGRGYAEFRTKEVVDIAQLPGTEMQMATVDERVVRIYKDGKSKEANTRHQILAARGFTEESLRRMVGNL